MPPGRQHPGRVFVERHGLVQDEDHMLRYADFLREEAGLDDTPPIDLDRIRRRFGLPKPILAALTDQQGILIDDEAGLILLKEDDPDARRRFTYAHELMELLFAACTQHTEWSPWQPRFSGPRKEQICNQGAAALLMPQPAFVTHVIAERICLEAGSRLAQRYETSFLATLRHMVRHTPDPYALVLWQYAHKPIQERQISPQQMQMFYLGEELTPGKKLRVQWVVVNRAAAAHYIPRHKSISEQSCIFQAYQSGGIERATEHLDLGQAPLHCEIEAKRVIIADEPWVVALLQFLPPDTPDSVQSDMDNLLLLKE
jgi:hypothetical protein